MKEPKHQQGDWKRQHERTEERVPEAVVRGKSQEVFEVWCEGSDQQSRSHEAEASERKSGGTVD